MGYTIPQLDDAATLDGTELVEVFQGTSPSKKTTTQTIANLGGGGLGYNLYTALLTQLGTAAPQANVLQNTLGDIIWTRDSVGIYFGTLTNGFPDGKTIINTFGNGGGGEIILGLGQSLPFDYGYSLYISGENLIVWQVYKTSDYSSVDFNDIARDTSAILVEIKVYP